VAVEAATDVAITQGGKEGGKEVQGETTTEEVKGTNKDVEAATSEVKLIKP